MLWKTTAGETLDQLQDVIEMIKKTPDSRRLIVSAWNPEDIPSMALPPLYSKENWEKLKEVA